MSRSSVGAGTWAIAASKLSIVSEVGTTAAAVRQASQANGVFARAAMFAIVSSEGRAADGAHRPPSSLQTGPNRDAVDEHRRRDEARGERHESTAKVVTARDGDVPAALERAAPRGLPGGCRARGQRRHRPGLR